MKTVISRSDIETIAAELDLRCTAGDIDQLERALPAYLGDIDATAELWDTISGERPELPRHGFRRPEPQEDPLNAWTALCSLRSAEAGPLAGRTVAVKDNIAVAGLPLTAGSRMLDGYLAEFDAVAVTRMLAAGVTITGITRCEDFCLSGGSHTGFGGPVRNPLDPTRTTGGSSSGSAAVVASGVVDLALGTDQGGSVRIPSAFCGIVGLKPTWERIPYSGAMSLAPGVDHIGPMARTVAELRSFFAVLAGESSGSGEVPLSAEGLRIGLLAEGFERTYGQPLVDEVVRNAVLQLASAGAVVTDMSVPMHKAGPAIWTAVGLAGLKQGLLCGDPWGIRPQAPYPLALVKKFREHQARRGFDASLRTKQFLIAAEFTQRLHGIEAAATSHCAATSLRARYDAALAECDMLAMPTTPHTAALLPDPDDLSASNFAAESMAANTCPFNLTHHPALSVPCGFVDGMPVGLMLVGRHGGEELLFRVGAVVERQARS